MSTATPGGSEYLLQHTLRDLHMLHGNDLAEFLQSVNIADFINELLTAESMSSIISMSSIRNDPRISLSWLETTCNWNQSWIVTQHVNSSTEDQFCCTFTLHEYFHVLPHFEGKYYADFILQADTTGVPTFFSDCGLKLQRFFFYFEEKKIPNEQKKL